MSPICIGELACRSSVVNTGVAFGGTRNEHLSLWTYNDRNELTGSARYADDDPESPENPVDAEQFAYTYDPIGNRTDYDVGVQDPSDTDYEANQLNQYLRAVTDDPNVAQGYRHDADGNLIEAFVAADMNCDGAIDSFDVSPFWGAPSPGRTASWPSLGPSGDTRTYPKTRHLCIPYTWAC